MNSQFWPLAPVGGRKANSMHFSTIASSTGSGCTRRTARWVNIASCSGMFRPASASDGAGATRNARAEGDSAFGVSVISGVLNDPLGGEVLDIRYPAGEFARDEALDRPA